MISILVSFFLPFVRLNGVFFGGGRREYFTLVIKRYRFAK